MKKQINEITKGMKIESWEIRESSNGSRKVYVRYVPGRTENK